MALQDSYWIGINDMLAVGATWEYTGQTFTTIGDFDYTITGVQLRCTRDGSPGTATVEIWATSDGLPTGSALSSGTFNADLLTEYLNHGTADTVVVSMSPVILTKNVKYAVVIDGSSFTIQDHIHIHGTSTSGYPYGNAVRYGYGSWFDATSAMADCAFRIEGDSIVPAPNKPINPTPSDGATDQRLNLASFLWEAG